MSEQKHGQRLADAVQAFRNVPALGKLGQLRSTPEYAELCEAWRAWEEQKSDLMARVRGVDGALAVLASAVQLNGAVRLQTPFIYAASELAANGLGSIRQSDEPPFRICFAINDAGRDVLRAVDAPALDLATTGMDRPWPLRDVVAKLVEAADHLLKDHDCDTHGHEEIATARDQARLYLGLGKEPHGR